MTNPETEVRALGTVELREAADGTPGTIAGYVSKFNTTSANQGGWVEAVAPGAFAESLATRDIPALYSHDRTKPLGRTSAGTLRLAEDAVGLSYECDLPDVSYARDLVVLIGRGDITGCSFAFHVEDDVLSDAGGGVVLRTLLRVRLKEVTLGCVWPAYADTTINLRSLSDHILARAAAMPRRDLARRWLDLAEF